MTRAEEHTSIAFETSIYLQRVGHQSLLARWRFSGRKRQREIKISLLLLRTFIKTRPIPSQVLYLEQEAISAYPTIYASMLFRCGKTHIRQTITELRQVRKLVAHGCRNMMRIPHDARCSWPIVSLCKP